MVRKEFPVLPLHLKRRHSPQERREELQGRATIPRVPQMSPSIAGKPVFPSLPRLSSRASTHTTVTRGRALWESLLGKPRGKASRESHRSLDPREGKLNTAAAARRKVHLHAPLITRTDSPGETPEYPKIHVSTGEESSGSGTDSTQGLWPGHPRERNPERPQSNSQGNGLSRGHQSVSLRSPS